MMGRQVAQGALFYGFRLDEHVPVDHLLRRIDGVLDFGFVREALASSYSASGRPSIDPELMLRMLLVGYLFGIRSERRLCEEVHLNLAYRWFCRLDLGDRVPDHSTFSKNRHGRFRACDLHRLLFEQVVARCAAAGLVTGRDLAVDGSTIMADASREKKLKGADAADELRAGESISRPVAEYLAALDAALPPDPDEPAPVDPTSISPTDPQAALTCKHGPARYAYAINPLLDLDTDCILDVEATPARFAAEVAATRTLVSRAGTRCGRVMSTASATALTVHPAATRSSATAVFLGLRPGTRPRGAARSPWPSCRAAGVVRAPAARARGIRTPAPLPRPLSRRSAHPAPSGAAR